VRTCTYCRGRSGQLIDRSIYTAKDKQLLGVAVTAHFAEAGPLPSAEASGAGAGGCWVELLDCLLESTALYTNARDGGAVNNHRKRNGAARPRRGRRRGAVSRRTGIARRRKGTVQALGLRLG
jgi:hypothetical protein